MDETEVFRIIDQLCNQGNAEHVSMWCWTHICWQCSHKKKEGT